MIKCLLKSISAKGVGDNMSEKVLILDNGSHSVKCGWRSDKSPETFYNWIMRPKDRRRQFVGSEIDKCQDMSNIHVTSPFQKVGEVHGICFVPVN